MESHFGASRPLSAFDAHFKGSFTADAELEFTLCAGEMHTSSFGQSIAKFATRTLDSMFFKMFFHPFGLIIGVVGFFPSSKVFARQPLMGRLPLKV